MICIDGYQKDGRSKGGRNLLQEKKYGQRTREKEACCTRSNEGGWLLAVPVHMPHLLISRR
jgi:hypothetical protein